MAKLSISDSKAIRRAMSEMPYGAGLTPRSSAPRPGLTGAEVATYLGLLADTLKRASASHRADAMALADLRIQQRHIGQFIRDAFTASGKGGQA